MEGPPLGPGGEDITWPDQVAPRGRKASSTRNIKSGTWNLMHPSVLELHALRIVRTPHADERQLYLKVRIMCGRKEVIPDVLVDTGAQVCLVQHGMFPDTCLKSSDRPVRLKVANDGIMGGGACEAELGLYFWEHDRLDRPDQANRLMLHGNFYEADLSDWDIMMGYNFMVSNSAGALPHPATLIRVANERLSWLSTHYAIGPEMRSRKLFVR